MLLAGAVLFWFVRRDRGDEAEEWTSAGTSAPDLEDTALSSTEALRAPSRDDESIVVLEQGSATDIGSLDEGAPDEPAVEPGGAGPTGPWSWRPRRISSAPSGAYSTRVGFAR